MPDSESTSCVEQVVLLNPADVYTIACGSGSSASLMKIQILKAKLQIAVWERYEQSVEQWHRFVIHKTEDKTQAVVLSSHGVDKTFSMPFAGEIVVSPVGKKEVYLLGEAWGVKFFMIAGSCYEMDSDCPVFPWMAKATKAGKDSVSKWVGG